MPAPVLPEKTARLIRRYVRRRRAVQIVRALVIDLLIILMWLTLTCSVDRYVPLPFSIRLAVEAATMIVALTIFFHSVKRLWTAVPWARVAMEIEQASGQFDGRLQTVISQAMEMPSMRGSPPLLQMLTGQTEQIAERIRPASLTELLPIRRPAAGIGALLIVLSLMAWVEPRMSALLMRGLLPWSDRTAARSTILQVLPGNISRAAGNSLLIVVHAVGLSDTIPTLQFHEDDPMFSSAPMESRENDFIFRFASVDRPLTYRVVAGDATSATYQINLIPGNSTASSQPIATTVPSETALTNAYLKAINRR